MSKERRRRPLLRHTQVWHTFHTIKESSFEWDDAKDRLNQAKHGVALAQQAFFDPARVIAEDLSHSETRAAISVSDAWTPGS